MAEELRKNNEEHKKTVEELRAERSTLSLQLGESKKMMSQMSAAQNELGSQQKHLKQINSEYREK